MTERRKIPDEELVEISGGIDVPLEDFEIRRPENSDVELHRDGQRAPRKRDRPLAGEDQRD